MELFEAFSLRACYRGEFSNDPVSRESLIKIVESGISAPSACNQQTPSFVIVDDPLILSKIAEVIPTPACKTAKAMIVCVSDARKVYADVSFYKEDCAAAVENMLLAITALGFASVWLDGVLRRDSKAERIAEILNVPVNKRVQILLPIGVPAQEIIRTSRHSFERRASFNTWDIRD